MLVVSYTRELLYRVLYFVSGYAVVFSMVYFYSDSFLFVFVGYLRVFDGSLPVQLVVSQVLEVFHLELLFSWIFSVYLYLPFFFFGCYSFFLEGAYRSSVAFGWVVLFFGVVVFYLGFPAVHFLLFPGVVLFFLSFRGGGVSLLSYVSFADLVSVYYRVDVACFFLLLIFFCGVLLVECFSFFRLAYLFWLSFVMIFSWVHSGVADFLSLFFVVLLLEAYCFWVYCFVWGR